MSPRSLARRFVFLTGLRWFPVGLTIPVLVLLMQARDLDLAQIGRIMALYGLVIIILELPTGGLADTVGRRPVLAASSLVSAAGSVVMAIAPSEALMALAAALLGTGRALASGPLEAWYVDLMRAEDPSADIGTGISRAQAVEALSLGVGALVGGALPALVAESVPGVFGPGSVVIAMSVPFLVASVLLLVHAGAVLVLVGETRGETLGSEGAASVTGTVAAGLAVVRRSPDLRRLVGYSAILGVTLGGVELVSPGAFERLLGGPELAGSTYGVLVGLGFAAAALGAVLAPRLAGQFTSARAAAFTLGLVMAPLAVMIGLTQLTLASAAFVLFYLVLGAQGPLLAGLLHDRVDAGQRSTVLSVESLAVSLGGVGASLAIGGIVAATTVLVGLGIVGAALVAGALLIRGVQDAPVVHGYEPAVDASLQLD